jgi:hypothetical protein
LIEYVSKDRLANVRTPSNGCLASARNLAVGLAEVADYYPGDEILLVVYHHERLKHAGG